MPGDWPGGAPGGMRACGALGASGRATVTLACDTWPKAFFTLSVSVHEHHLLMAVPLLAVAAALDRRFRGVFYAVSAMVFLNINLFYGISRGWGWAIPRDVTPIDLSVLLAFAGLGIFAWHALVLTRATRG